MHSPPDDSYIDEKGRTRWRRNDWLAEKLNELYDILVIGGYDESHAARYPRLAHAISRYPISIDTLNAEDRLGEIPGVGEIVATIIRQTLERGTSDKFEEWAKDTPLSVLELSKIPRLGAKTLRMLYAEHGVDSVASLKHALESGRMNGIPGIGPKMIATMREFVEHHSA